MILLESHDIAIAGHLEVKKILKSIQQVCVWPKLLKNVKIYVQGCVVCLQNKTSNLKLVDLLQPLLEQQ